MRNKKWMRLLAYVTGSVNQELLLQNEYLAAKNRILRSKLPSRLRLSNPERATLAETGRAWEWIPLAQPYGGQLPVPETTLTSSCKSSTFATPSRFKSAGPATPLRRLLIKSWTSSAFT